MMITALQYRTRLIGQLSMISTWAIILAAGSGTRMELGIPKQFLDWKGRPLYWHSVMTFCRVVSGIVLVLPENFVESEQERLPQLISADNPGVPIFIARGGQRRQDSCANGLAMLPPSCANVLVHDAARPFVTPELVYRVQGAIGLGCPCVVPAIPVTDTIKMLSASEINNVECTLPRERLIATQTPQGFQIDILKSVMGDEDVTDEATLLEKNGYPVKIVPGDIKNRKITNREDLALLKDDEPQIDIRTGFGYDVHRFGGARPLKLGGILIPGPYTVEAHSDGDVLLHALMDALLALGALGDIGRHFPDSDPAYENISSSLLLDRVLEKLNRLDIRIIFADLTVVTQKPRLAHHAEQIKHNIARLLQLPGERVNFKATTEEKLGFTGACQGIKAFATVTGVKASRTG